MLKCSECRGVLRYHCEERRPLFLCNRCGGMFEAAPILRNALGATIETIHNERKGGVVHCGFDASTTIESTTAAFELYYKEGAFSQVELREAKAIVAGVLFADLAYQSPIMEREVAEGLAEAFLRPLVAAEFEFFVTMHYDFGNGRLGSAWTPVTAATFDAGVIAIGSAGSACVWVEDED